MQHQPDRPNTTEAASGSTSLTYLLYVLVAFVGFVQLGGVDFSAVVMALFLLVVSVFIHRQEKFGFIWVQLVQGNKIEFALFFIWLFFALVSVALSPIFSDASGQMYLISLTRLALIVSFFIFAVYLYQLLDRNSYPVEMLLKIIIGVMLIIIGNMFIVWNLYEDFRDPDIWFDRPPGYSHIRHAGYHVEVASVFCLYFLLKSSSKLAAFWPAVLCLSVLWAFNFWMGGRGAMIATFLASLCLIAMAKYKGLGVARLSSGFFLSLMIGVVLAESAAVMDWNGLLNASMRSLDADSANALTTGRTDIWMTGVSALEGHWLLGLGTNSYRFLPNHIYGSHPHNLIIQMLLDYGVVGFLAMTLLLTGFFVKGAVKNIQDSCVSEISLVSGALIVCLVLAAMIDGTFYHTQPTTFLVFAFVFWLKPKGLS